MFLLFIALCWRDRSYITESWSGPVLIRINKQLSSKGKLKKWYSINTDRDIFISVQVSKQRCLVPFKSHHGTQYLYLERADVTGILSLFGSVAEVKAECSTALQAVQDTYA